MKYYEKDCGIKEFRKSRPAKARQRWFNKKGIDSPTKQNYRDYRGAVAVCHKKLRYSFISACWDAIRLNNHIYHCVICNHWHTSRQSKTVNRILHHYEKGLSNDQL